MEGQVYIFFSPFHFFSLKFVSGQLKVKKFIFTLIYIFLDNFFISNVLVRLYLDFI